VIEAGRGHSSQLERMKKEEGVERGRGIT